MLHLYGSKVKYANEVIGINSRIPVTTAEYGLSKAARPFNSWPDKSKFLENGFVSLPDRQNALRRYLLDMHKQEIRYKLEDMQEPKNVILLL